MTDMIQVDPVLGLAIQGAFALLFALAGVEKWHDRDTFLFQLEQYQLLPEKMIPAVGMGVIFTELATATALILPDPVYGVWMGSILLSVYALAIFINLLRGRTWMDCGCLGSEGEGLSYWLVVRNLVLLTALIILLLPIDERSLIWLDYFSIVFSIFCVSLAYAILNTLLAANTRSKMWWS